MVPFEHIIQRAVGPHDEICWQEALFLEFAHCESLRNLRVLGTLAAMSTCPSFQYPATKRDGYDAAGRQRYHCRPCHRDFTAHSASVFSGYRWPPDVILMAVRWDCSLPLSAAQVVRL